MLIIIGLIIIFVAICFAAINLFCNIGKLSSAFESLFKRHLIAIIVMLFGGLLLAIGLVLCAADILSRVIY